MLYFMYCRVTAPQIVQLSERVMNKLITFAVRILFSLVLYCRESHSCHMVITTFMCIFDDSGDCLKNVIERNDCLKTISK